MARSIATALVATVGLALFLGTFSPAGRADHGSKQACSQEGCSKQHASAGTERLSALAEGWKSALAEEASRCPAERGRVAAALAEARQSCPAAARLGETLTFARDVLSLASSLDAGEKSCGFLTQHQALAGGLAQLTSVAVEGLETCGGAGGASGSAAAAPVACCAAETGSCPKAEGTCSKHPAACPKAQTCCASATASASVKAGGSTSKAQVACAQAEAPCAKSSGGEVASAATPACCASGTAAASVKHTDAASCSKAGGTTASAKAEGSCTQAEAPCAKSSGGEVASAATPGACCAAATGPCPKAEGSCAKDPATCAKAERPCPKTLLARAAELKEAWKIAGEAYASMGPTKRQDLLSAHRSLEASCKLLSLVPETLVALADGLERLDAMNAKAKERTGAHPEAAAAVPEALRERFESQARLVREAKEVLAGVASLLRQRDGGPSEPAVALQREDG